MHLSYNVIKNYNVESKEKVNIETESIIQIDKSEENASNNLGVSYEEAQFFIKNYEKIGQNIIEDAKRKRDEYIVEMVEKAKVIEKEAYEKGYSQGVINGEEDGKKEAYESCIPNAIKKAEEIISNAEETLKSAKKNYEAYLEEKKSEILELSITIAEQVIKKELEDKAGLNSMLENALKDSKGLDNVIIKCNSVHIDEIKSQCETWKTINNIIGEIFVISDNNMKPGNAVIEKSTGKVEVGIDIGLNKIKEVLL